MKLIKVFINKYTTLPIYSYFQEEDVTPIL